MNKKIIIGILVVIGIFGAMLWGKTRQATLPGVKTAEATSALQASETLYDFGTISMAKGNVTRSFVITNPTSEDILLDTLTTSCMCTAAYLINDTSKRGPFGMPGMVIVPKANDLIRAGESRTIDVVYNPAAHGPAGVGPIDRFVFLQDSKGGLLRLEIKALVTP